MNTQNNITRKTPLEKPSQTFGKLMFILRMCAGVCGCDYLNSNWRINVNWYWSLCTIVFYFVCTFLTIWRRFEEDWTIILESLCMSSSVIQGAVKLGIGYKYQKELAQIREWAENTYATYEKNSQRYCEALQKCCDNQLRILKIMMFTYMFPCLGIVFVPIVILLTTGKRHLMMPFEVPGLDVGTDLGYFCTIGLQLSTMTCGGFGLMAGDIMLLIILEQPETYIGIMRLKIEELNLLTEAKEKNENEILNSLIDVVKWHQSYSDFTVYTNSIISPVITVGTLSSAFSIVLSLYMILLSDWPGAYPYLVISCHVLYYICILGTKTEICNDQFTDEIYEISWYNMTVPHQKIVHRMLLQSQFPKTINVANVLPCSVSTALQITKTIYSMFMMMLRFLRD